jgi:peptidoglycan L-alanyl-D-glutamate endopeptidase CwlK
MHNGVNEKMATLIKGASGPDVEQLQKQLQARGFSPGNIDGTFGGGTEAALIAFQKSEGLLADGVAGPKTLASLGLAVPDDAPSAIPGLTVAVVAEMFPSTPIGSIRANLPSVLDALVDAQLSDKPMALMALATIRAETESFQPVAEGQSRFNTSPNGHPFDLYDNRKDLGNLGPPDGTSFRGRGFVQLTGRANYAKYGAAIGLGDQLVTNPDKASDPDIAAKLLTAFLAAHEMAIKQALLEDDLRTARKLVNGGSNGLDRFMDAYTIGNRLLA